MRVGQNFFPKSSFLVLEKDYALIFDKILRNQRLLKMLYYTQPDCLSAPDLSAKQIQSMINKQIRIVPYYEADNTICPNFLVVTMDNFIPNATNPEFRDCSINFDILCHYDHWNLGNFQLRPYKIAGELDAMFEKQKLTGIGELQLMAAKNFALTDDIAGLTLVYEAIHGIEDKLIVDNG